ncbi:hypothetical protein [Kitasatospora sp. NPDC101183]|uniref:hypothetical protein n=1 Tax=Kitasatospora sp. NPDC101183 TaxID=3364100 RepID=UPI00382A3F55
MACRVRELAVAAADAEGLAVFRAAVLGYVEVGADPEGNEFCLLRARVPAV